MSRKRHKVCRSKTYVNVYYVPKKATTDQRVVLQKCPLDNTIKKITFEWKVKPLQQLNFGLHIFCCCWCNNILWICAIFKKYVRHVVAPRTLRRRRRRFSAHIFNSACLPAYTKYQIFKLAYTRARTLCIALHIHTNTDIHTQYYEKEVKHLIEHTFLRWAQCT